MKKNTTNELSPEIKDVLGRQNNGYVKYGYILFLLILILMLFTSWIIKSPYLVETTAKLSSINAPRSVICLKPGKLIELKITEGQQVKAGEVIGVMESVANAKEVQKLSVWVNKIRENLIEGDISRLDKIMDDRFNSLGELQQSYQTFAQAYLVFRDYLPDGYITSKKKLLQKDMRLLKELKSKNLDQLTLQKEDLGLTKKTFDANEYLKTEKVVSEFEYRNEKSKLLGKELVIPQAESNILLNEGQQNEKLKQILQINNEQEQQKYIFGQALNSLASSIDQWKKTFLLVAPVDGKIAFTGIIEENQQLTDQQSICYVIPANAHYYAETIIPQKNFGKVLIGQKVLLKFPSYPHREYGSLVGYIEFISYIPTEKGYVAKVSLPTDLVTTQHHKIQFRDGLTADASIVTKDMRFIERFYYKSMGSVD